MLGATQQSIIRKLDVRIAVISKGAWPQITGGAELVTHEVVKGLKKRGHEVFLVTREWELKDGARPEMSQIINWEWAADAARRAIEYMPHVVYISQYWWEAAAVYMVETIPVVLMVHDLGFLEARLAPDVLYQMLHVWQRSLERANHIIVSGKITREKLLLAFPRVEDKLRFIPLGISV